MMNNIMAAEDHMDKEEYPVPGLYVEETVCPYPDRECCDGCPRYIEDENLCDLEL